MADIVRVFQADVKAGKADEFRAFFLGEALPLVRGYPGLVSVEVGLPEEDTPRSFLMITTWSSVAALTEFAGPDWRHAVIDPREAHLLERTRVSHYLRAEA